MSRNLGEISELKIGLDSMYQFITAYKKIKKVTGDSLVLLDSIENYYERNKQTLNNLKKTLDDLK